MLPSGTSVLLTFTENPVQPTSFSERTTNSTGHE